MSLRARTTRREAAPRNAVCISRLRVDVSSVPRRFPRVTTSNSVRRRTGSSRPRGRDAHRGITVGEGSYSNAPAPLPYESNCTRAQR